VVLERRQFVVARKTKSIGVQRITNGGMTRAKRAEDERGKSGQKRKKLLADRAQYPVSQ